MIRPGNRHWKASLFAVVLGGQPLGPASVPQDVLGCERTIIHRGKTLPCDSPVAPDGEALRMLLQDTPESLQALDQYQSNRRTMTATSYTGMVGLLLAAFAPRLSSDSSTREKLMFGGIGLTIGSFAFGKARLRANERHLDRAIETYNRVHPADPIQLNRSP